MRGREWKGQEKGKGRERGKVGQWREGFPTPSILL